MQRIPRYLTSFLLGAALVAPMGLQAVNDRDHDRDDRNKKVRRYYDREHRDYHEWNEAENNAYRHWLMEERREAQYREYARLQRERQIEYWRWRHEHPDWH